MICETWRATIGRALNRLDRNTQAVLLVVACAAAVRAPGAIRDAFWQDEVASARVLVEPTAYGALRHVARAEATPPLWYMLGWLAHEVGISPYGYRWLSVLSGAAAAGLTVVYARRILPLWASTLAGLLAAFGWELVVHGRELRAYALFSLLAVLFPLVLEHALRGSTRRRAALLALTVAAGTMTSYFFGLTLVAGLAWIWLEPSVRPHARRLTLAIGAGIVPLVAWSPVLVHQYRAQRFAWIGPFNLRRWVDAFWALFIRHTPGHSPLWRTLAALLILAVVGGTGVLAARSPRGRLCALMALLPFTLVTIAWAGGSHVFIARNLVGVAPFAAVGLAALPTLLPRRVALTAAAAGAAAVAAGTVRGDTSLPPQYDGVAHALVQEGWNRHDPIALLRGDFFSFGLPLGWYLPGQQRLTLGRPVGGTPCPSVYVLVDGRASRFRLQLLALKSRVVGGVLVGHLRSTSLTPWARVPLFASESGHAPCVRLVPEARLVSELRRLRRTGT